MGKRNKVVKLTEKKIKYIIRAKTNNISTKRIALEMKVSESTVKRVWMYWKKTACNCPLRNLVESHKSLMKNPLS
jgi:transposase